MTLQSALATVGVAKQTARGTAITTATYGHGLTDGGVMEVEVDQEMEDHTSGVRASVAINRNSVVPGIDFTTRAHPRSVGMWLLGALGGVVTSGTGPYTHTFSLASALPYLTTFGTFGGQFSRVQDVKLDSLGFSWTGNEPLEVSVSGTGTVATVLGAAYTTTTDEAAATYMRPCGGTFTVDVDGAGGTAATAKILGGEVTISNNVEAILVSGTITPDDVFEGRQEVECSLDVNPDDLLLWRTIFAGTAAGTTAGQTVVYGTFSCQFTDGTNTLTLAGTRVAFTCDFPDADPSGGNVTLTLAGMAVSDGTTSPVTAALVNSAVSY